MIKYLTKGDFIELITKVLPVVQEMNIPIESSYDGGEYIYKFAYVDFNGGTFLYSGGYPEVGVIQDTQMYTFEEQLETIWEEMVTEEEDKPFIYVENELNTESSDKSRGEKTEDS